MKQVLGFTSFASSKGQTHADQAAEGVYKGKNNRRRYRQYMNRKGGFNRPLDKLV